MKGELIFVVQASGETALVPVFRVVLLLALDCACYVFRCLMLYAALLYCLVCRLLSTPYTRMDTLGYPRHFISFVTTHPNQATSSMVALPQLAFYQRCRKNQPDTNCPRG